MHPATEQLLQYFEYEHLPEHLMLISKPVFDLAHDMANNPALSGTELTAGLRKLLEAKDCFVRAALANKQEIPPMYDPHAERPASWPEGGNEPRRLG